MRKILAALALVALAGCGDSLTDPFNSSLAGSYSLRTVDGQSLPYTVSSNSSASATLLTDVLTVGDNGTWSEVYTYRQTVNGQTTSGTGNDGGNWTRSGNNVTFRSTSGGDGYNGTFDGSSFTLSDGFDTYVFR